MAAITFPDALDEEGFRFAGRIWKRLNEAVSWQPDFLLGSVSVHALYYTNDMIFEQPWGKKWAPSERPSR